MKLLLNGRYVKLKTNASASAFVSLFVNRELGTEPRAVASGFRRRVALSQSEFGKKYIAVAGK